MWLRARTHDQIVAMVQRFRAHGFGRVGQGGSAGWRRCDTTTTFIGSGQRSDTGQRCRETIIAIVRMEHWPAELDGAV